MQLDIHSIVLEIDVVQGKEKGAVAKVQIVIKGNVH